MTYNELTCCKQDKNLPIVHNVVEYPCVCYYSEEQLWGWLVRSAVWHTVGKLTCPSSPALVHLGERKREMGYCEWIETERNTTDIGRMCFLLCEMQLIRLTDRKRESGKTLCGTECERFTSEPWCEHVCARVWLSALHTSVGLAVLPLFVHKHQDKRQSEQSHDAGCYGQGHWHSAWGRNRETES